MKVCLVGGGVSGALAALYFQKYHPNWTVTIVENPNISPVPVGENLHRNAFRFFCDVIDQPWHKTVREMIDFNCTIKLGGHFPGWSEKFNTWYVLFSGKSNEETVKLHNTWIANNQDNLSLDYYDYVYPDVMQHIRDNTIPENYLDRSLELCTMCVDATKISDYLKTKFRGEIIKGNVIGIKRTEQKLEQIELEDGRSISADLFFDCTGFKRVLISHFSEFSVIERGMVNSALVGPSKHKDGVIPVYLSSINKEHGWMFKIPMQHRIGVGYVFNDQITDIETIRQERKKEIIDSDSELLLKWVPSQTDKAWSKNVVSLGLASFFNEPLIGTSLELTTRSIVHFDLYYGKSGLDGHKEYNDWFNVQKDLINTKLFSMYYYCKRNDTEFWKYVRQKCQDNEFHEKMLYLIHGGFNELLKKYPGLMWNQEHYEYSSLFMEVPGINLKKQPEKNMNTSFENIKAIKSNEFYKKIRSEK